MWCCVNHFSSVCLPRSHDSNLRELNRIPKFRRGQPSLNGGVKHWSGLLIIRDFRERFSRHISETVQDKDIVPTERY